MSRLFYLIAIIISFGLIAPMMASNKAHAGFVVKIYDTSTAISSLDDILVQTLLAGNPTTTAEFNSIDFSDQGNGLPFPIANPETFLVTIDGSFEITLGGNYTFQAFHDDGVRVSVNNTQVINSPLPTPPISSFGTIFLSAGFHNLSVLYFERFTQAELQISLARGAGVTNSSFFNTITFAAPQPIPEPSPQPIPEPSSLPLIALGILGLYAKRLKTGLSIQQRKLMSLSEQAL